MSLTDYQRQFNGLTLGDGTAYEILEETGLEGFEVRSGSRSIPRDDGAIPGLHLVSGKMVVLPVEVFGDPETVITPAINAAREAFAPQRTTELQYRFKNPGDDEKFVWARAVRFERSRTVRGSLGVDGFQVGLELADPRIYSVEVHQLIVPEFDTGLGSGLNSPLNSPLNMTAGAQQTGIAVNAGARDAYPRIVFQHDSGTVSGVLLTNQTNGDELDIDTSIGSGQQLVADMDALIRATGDSVISIGGSSRYGDWQLPRNPFRLSPGSNTLTLETTGGGAVICSLTWRDTD